MNAHQLYVYESTDDFDKHYTRFHNYLMFLDIQPNTLKLLLHYSRICMMKNKVVTASDETIGEMANMSAKTVSRSRKELEKLGLIQIVEVIGKPYIIKIDFTNLKKENETFWKTHDIMGKPLETPRTKVLTTPDKSSEGVGQNVLPTPDKSSDKELSSKELLNKKELSPGGDAPEFLVSNTGMIHMNDSGQPLCNTRIKDYILTDLRPLKSKVCSKCLKKLNKPKKTTPCEITDGMTPDERSAIFDWIAKEAWDYEPDEFKLLDEDTRQTAGARIGKIIKCLRKINHSYGTKLGLEYLKPFWAEFSESGLDLKSDVKWSERYLAWYMQQKRKQEAKLSRPKPSYREAPPDEDTYTRRTPVQLGRTGTVRL